MIQVLQTYLETYLRPIRNDESGQGLVEYALIIALVALLLVGALALFRGDIAEALENVW